MELSGRNYNSKFKFIFILRSSGITLINSDCGDAASDRMETIFSLVLFSINFNLNQPPPACLCSSVLFLPRREDEDAINQMMVMVSPSVHYHYHRGLWKVSSHSTDINILSLCSKLDCSSYQISNKQWTWLLVEMTSIFWKDTSQFWTMWLGFVQ